MIKVGIIGTGVMGAGHARFIKEHISNAVVTALSDIDDVRMQSLATEIDTVQFQTNSAKELMNSDLVDAVIIASPDPLHVEHLEIAIASKKPTLCEKPIATTLEEARQIAIKIKKYESEISATRIHFGYIIVTGKQIGRAHV